MRIHPIAAFIFSALALIASIGCKTIPGAPPATYNAKKQIKDLAANFDESAVIKEYAEETDPVRKRNIRDRYISTRMTLIELNYQKWVHSEVFHRQVMDTVTDLTILGVNAAGTLVGGAETKAILAAISGGIVGSKTAIDKNFFYEKTIAALVIAMEAERQKKLNPIILGAKNDLVEGDGGYPLAQAVIDLNAFYFAGTFLGAINGIQAESSIDAKNASEINNQAKMTSDQQEAVPADKKTNIENNAAHLGLRLK